MISFILKTSRYWCSYVPIAIPVNTYNLIALARYCKHARGI